MVRIRRNKGGCGIGPHWWPEGDPVCDVPEELARDLLANPEEGYSVEPDPEEEPGPSGDGEATGDGEDDGGSDGQQAPEEEAGDGGQQEKPKAPARRRKPTTA